MYVAGDESDLIEFLDNYKKSPSQQKWLGGLFLCPQHLVHQYLVYQERSTVSSVTVNVLREFVRVPYAT